MNNGLALDNAQLPPLAPASAPPPLPSAAGLHQQFADAHDSAKSLHDTTSVAMDHLDTMTDAIKELLEKGDTVTPADVIEQMGDLVGAGNVAPNEAAGELSSMPLSGPAIQGWLRQHLQKQQAMQQQAQQLHAVARHEMGVSALRGLMANAGHLNGLPAAGPAQPSGSPMSTPTSAPLTPGQE